jgi:hypothetical protein
VSSAALRYVTPSPSPCCSDGPEFRDVVIHSGAIAPLTRHMHHLAPLCFIRNAVWTISNFCRGKPPADFAKVRPRSRVCLLSVP